MNNVYTSYLYRIYDPETGPLVLRALGREVLARRDQFDTLAFRGSSGTPALALSLMHGIPCLHVRKDLGHGAPRVEGCYGGPRIAVVDDFVVTGETIRRIREEVKTAHEGAELSHLFLYGTSSSSMGLKELQGAISGLLIVEVEL